MSSVVVYEFVARFLEEPDGSLVVVLYLRYYLVPVVNMQGELFNGVHNFMCESLPPILLNGNHNVNLGLVVFNPIREKQINVSNEPIVSLEKD